jgi:hypothetical protein
MISIKKTVVQKSSYLASITGTMNAVVHPEKPNPVLYKLNIGPSNSLNQMFNNIFLENPVAVNTFTVQYYHKKTRVSILTQ